MPELRHLISNESRQALVTTKRLLGDPMEMNKTLFVQHLERLGDHLFGQYTTAGLSEDQAFDRTRDELAELTQRWKEARP